MLNWLKNVPQYVLPHHIVSRTIGWFANSKCQWFKRILINFFIKAYKVNMQEALETNPDKYESFNQFFTRPLKPDARKLDIDDTHILSPVDGFVSQIGKVNGGVLVQAKGHSYRAVELLGGDFDIAEAFIDASFANLYLSPRDYHRIHMPCDGKLVRMIYIPGKLFSVQPRTVNTIPKLFARNERVVCLFETDMGPMAMVLVGAMIVASIHTKWHGTVAPGIENSVRQWVYPNPKISAVELRQGEEMGYFNLGSTVILLFANKRLQWNVDLKAGVPIQLGNKLGNIT